MPHDPSTILLLCSKTKVYVFIKHSISYSVSALHSNIILNINASLPKSNVEKSKVTDIQADEACSACLVLRCLACRKLQPDEWKLSLIASTG